MREEGSTRVFEQNQVQLEVSPESTIYIFRIFLSRELYNAN